MAKSKAEPPVLAKSLDALVEYFGTHDLGENWEEMPIAKVQH